MLNRRLAIASLLLAALAAAAPAQADLTAFLGYSPTPFNRSARGVAVGFGFLIVAFEFEYSNIPQAEDGLSVQPGIQFGMFNGLVQTPIAVGGVQFYFTAGGGVYREKLTGGAGNLSETNFGTNVGGGAKIRLAGPIRLRLDYRMLTLRGDPVVERNPEDRYHRFYAGLNLAF
jgi:hypothetical protein